ncbi:MAG: aldehyde dehydrogenase family protein [Actinomycetes bacterium]
MAYDNINQLLIAGKRTSGRGTDTRDVVHPASGKVVATVCEATADDTNDAISAARSAFDNGHWSSFSAEQRSKILDQVAETLTRDKEAFARAESQDTAKRIVEANYDLDDVISVFRHFAREAVKPHVREVNTGRDNVRSRIVSEPVGAVAMITPWNYPLLQASWKVAPAIAAGCTFVIKPSELTPSTTSMLMDVLSEAGLPDGVANLILGAGAVAGAPLSTHPDIDMVSFTGGLETGKRLMANAAQTVKKVALELGGKNPNIIFADADLEAAIDNALTAVFLHSGQVCSAGARLLVERSVHDRVVDEVARRADGIVLGGAYDDAAQTGALISAGHREKVERYVAAALAEGAVLRAGGHRPTEPELQDGFFYRPTVLDNCTTDMTCVQDESFGPVLTVEVFDTEDEAIRLGNDTIFGLAGAVWTKDIEKAERVAGKLRHGTIWINDYHPYVAQAEWGGYKQSGVGRELGEAGFAEYLEHKHIWHNLAPAPSEWFPKGQSS